MNKSESDTLISECNFYEAEVPKMLTEYSLVAYALIQQEEYHKALQLLSQSEELLEAVTSQGGTVDLDYILLTVHNSAFCYMKLKMLQECASYIDACIYNSESKKLAALDVAGPASLLCALKKEKYESAIHLHHSFILKSLKNHEDSLKHAQVAFKKSLLCMKICYKICIGHLTRHNKLMTTESIRKRLLKQSQYNLIESSHYQEFHKQVNEAFPFLQYFHNKYYATSRKTSKVNLKSAVANLYSESNWVLSANLEEVSSLKPINPININNTLGIQTEISKENMIHKLLHLICSMTLISTELKYSNKREEAKAWHKKTLQSAGQLLPNTSNIVKEIKESYIKEYDALDFYKKKPRHHTLSNRLQTPAPHQVVRMRNKSYYEKATDGSRINAKTPQLVFKSGNESKTCATPQPRPTTQGSERRKIKEAEEGLGFYRLS